MYESEVHNDDLNPNFKPFLINIGKLCESHSELFEIECWDYDEIGKHDFIGKCHISINEIFIAKTSSFKLENAEYQ